MSETGAFSIDQRRIEDAIVADVAYKLIGDEDLYGRVTRAVDTRIDKHFKEVADEQIRSAIELAIADGFERSYRKVDAFGQAQGEQTSIRKELERLIAGYWNEQVGRDGKPTTSSYSATTRAEWMMTQLVASDFQGEMKQHIVNLGGALKDQLRAEMANTLNKLLSDVFHVNSHGDQKLAAQNKQTGSAIIRDKAK